MAGPRSTQRYRADWGTSLRICFGLSTQRKRDCSLGALTATSGGREKATGPQVPRSRGPLSTSVPLLKLPLSSVFSIQKGTVTFGGGGGGSPRSDYLCGFEG